MRSTGELLKRKPVELYEPSLREPAAAHRYDGEQYAEEQARLRDFVSALRRRLWLIALLTVLCTALVALYMSRQPDSYEAAAQVQVDLETVSTASVSSKTNAFVVSPVNDPAYFNTQLQILTGARLLRRVVKTLDLEHDPSFTLPPQPARAAADARAIDMRPAGSPPGNPQHAVAPTASREDLAEAARLAPYVEGLRQNLRVEPVKEVRLPVKDTRLINIHFNHTDSPLAADVVNAIADAFVAANYERKVDTTTTTGNILQDRISELRAQIRGQEGQLLQYANNNQILSLDESQNTVVERLVGLNRQLLEAENERKIAEASYRAALIPGAASALAEGDIKNSPQVQDRLAQLLQRREELLVENTEEWPEVKEVDRQIAVLERQLQDVRDRASTVVLTNLGTRYRQATSREQSLRDAFQRQRAETLTQNQAAINYRIIQQEIETNKGLLEGMLQRSKETEAALSALRNNIHVNEYAVAPVSPVGPPRLLYTGVAFALSLGFGVGLAVLLGYMDDSVRSIDDVRKTLHVPTLAAIPCVRSRPRFLHAARRDGEAESQAEHAELLLNPNAPAPLTEAHRQLRTAMMLSTAQDDVKSLLVTSGEPGEGKSTTAVNTAISFARTGALVLVVDADMRRPCLHTILNLENRKGLSTILSGDMSEGDALKIITHHAPSGLDVLTSGPVLPNAAELLGSEQMRRLMCAFHTTYDYVVIDSPPISYFMDGVLLSSLTDGVVLVVNSGKSTRESVRRSYQLLQDVGANVCGVALNNVKGLKYDYKYYAQSRV